MISLQFSLAKVTFIFLAVTVFICTEGKGQFIAKEVESNVSPTPVCTPRGSPQI